MDEDEGVVDMNTDEIRRKVMDGANGQPDHRKVSDNVVLGMCDNLDATRAKLAEAEARLTYWYNADGTVTTLDANTVTVMRIKAAKRLAEVERERHREHEARVQMEHELSEAGCATVADLVRERDEARDKRAHETQHLLNCCAERDKALAASQAECVRLREALEDCEDWFGERADADAQGDPMEYVGNAEMHALGRVRRALAATAPGSRKALREKMLVAWMGGAFSGAAWMYAHLGGDEATALAHLNRFQAAAAGTTKAFHDWFASKYDGEEEADG